MVYLELQCVNFRVLDHKDIYFVGALCLRFDINAWECLIAEWRSRIAMKLQELLMPYIPKTYDIKMPTH